MSGLIKERVDERKDKKKRVPKSVPEQTQCLLRIEPSPAVLNPAILTVTNISKWASFASIMSSFFFFVSLSLKTKQTKRKKKLKKQKKLVKQQLFKLYFQEHQRLQMVILLTCHRILIPPNHKSRPRSRYSQEFRL